MIKKRSCIFTFVKNEKVFLLIWLRYYSKFFNKEDIYVLDHDSNDGSIEDCRKHYGFNVIPLHWEFYDDIWRAKMVCSKQIELLQSYEYVLYSDADEIIIPDPEKYRDLKHYISNLDKDYVSCVGYHLIHIREKEASIDLSKSILRQRSYWYADAHYNKPLLARVPLKWYTGFHSASNCGDNVDKNLWLLHLHKMDFDLCWQKHREIASLKWHEDCIKRNHAGQFRITTLKDFKKYFQPNYVQEKGLKLYLATIECFLKWVIAIVFKLKTAASWHDWKNIRLKTITELPTRLKKTEII